MIRLKSIFTVILAGALAIGLSLLFGASPNDAGKIGGATMVGMIFAGMWLRRTPKG